MDPNDICNKLAGAMLAYRDNILKVVEDLSDDELVDVIDLCRREAQPDETKNFPIPAWDHVASVIEKELVTRISVRAAQEYMERTGETYYCVHCQGACTPEHLAEMGD